MVERQSVCSHESSAPAPFRTNIERLFFSSAESAQDGARARAFLDASPMVPLPEDCADRAGLRPLVPAASAAGDLDETFVHVQEDVPLLTTRLPTSFASHSLNTGRADEDEDHPRQQLRALILTTPSAEPLPPRSCTMLPAAKAEETA